MHYFSRKPLHRRTVLRGLLGGAAIGVALPPLEAFFNANGTAYAACGNFPKRFGMYFWGNGVLPERWIPSTTGPDFALSDALAPLADFRDYLTVLSGFEVKTDNPIAHGSGPGGFFSGHPVIVNGEDYTFAAPTIDQIMAAEIGGETRFRSIELAVEPGGSGFSFNGPDSNNAPESNPALLFDRLFGAGFRAPGDEVVVDPSLSFRRSVLDAVMADSRKLSARLGANDKRRLDQHFSAVRDLELRIARLEEEPANFAGCVRPTMPTPIPEVEGRPQMSAIAHVMADLTAMAFACDLTRVLTFWYSGALSNVLYPGAKAGHHQLTHDEPGIQEQVHNIVVSIIEDLAYLLGRLSSIEEGDGHILDHTVIMATTDVSYGRTHAIDEYPVALLGNACGALKSGFHYRSETKENTSMISLSLLRAMGVQRADFGIDRTLVTDGLSEIDA